MPKRSRKSITGQLNRTKTSYDDILQDHVSNT